MYIRPQEENWNFYYHASFNQWFLYLFKQERNFWDDGRSSSGSRREQREAGQSEAQLESCLCIKFPKEQPSSNLWHQGPLELQKLLPLESITVLFLLLPPTPLSERLCVQVEDLRNVFEGFAEVGGWGGGGTSGTEGGVIVPSAGKSQ